MQTMKTRRTGWLMGLLLLAVACPGWAACPGDSAFATIKSIVINSPGVSINAFIEIDASAGASVDVCGCKNGSNQLFLLRPENPVTEGTKMLMALAMEAKALNKRIMYSATGCYSGSGSGFVGFSQIGMEP